MTASAPSILLTAAEKKLFLFLNEVSSKSNTPVVCRVAGGWVRDKLLGHTTNDLDIALDSLMGMQFAKALSRFLKVPENAAKYSLNGPVELQYENKPLITHIGKIKANPLKSKHLETAACHVFGFSLDFVNLRSESYNENSRIPDEIALERDHGEKKVSANGVGFPCIVLNYVRTVQHNFLLCLAIGYPPLIFQVELDSKCPYFKFDEKFGTPLEDALRRDCTINALFYNIATETVEDFTGRGLEDLKNKIIRTPLAPKTTFQDDPLRVLRAVRFAARFDFALHDDVKESAKDPEILKFLATKISRERIGEEISKMLDGPSPTYAISLLCDLGVLQSVLSDSPPNSQVASAPTTPDAATVAAEAFFAVIPRAFAILDWLRSTRNAHYPRLRTLPLPRQLPFLALMALPFAMAGATGTDTHLKACLKLCNKDTQFVAATCAALPRVKLWRAEARTGLATHFGGDPRVELGVLVRTLATLAKAGGGGELGTGLLLLSLVFELTQVVDELAFETSERGTVVLVDPGTKSPAVTDLLQSYHLLFEEIETLGLSDAWKLAPLLNGTEICEKLHIPPGPKVKALLEALIEWQLAHPSATDPASCLPWLSTCLASDVGHSESRNEREGPASKRTKRARESRST